MARAALLLAAACIGGDAQIPPCPAGVKDDLNWYTTTSSGKVHDCAWLRLDPDTRCNNDGRFLNCPAACGKCLGVCQNDERDDDSRAVRNRHRHAIEQASRRRRGGQRDDSARTRRKILISTQMHVCDAGAGGA